MFLGKSSSGKGGKEEDLSLGKICKGSTFSLWLHHMQPFHLKDFLLFLSYSLFSEEKKGMLKQTMHSCFVNPCVSCFLSFPTMENKELNYTLRNVVTILEALVCTQCFPIANLQI